MATLQVQPGTQTFGGFNPPRSSQYGGMFGGGGGSMYTPRPSIFGPTSFDVSGIQKGAEMMGGATPYKPSSYNPYQFNAPEFGTTSPEQMGDIYSQAMGVASRPLRSQAREQQRQMSQGLEGGRFTGAAQREAAMKGGMETGERLSDIGASIGAGLSKERLGELQTQRAMQFQAEQDRQRQQSEENFRSAGFSDQQARYMAEEQMNRARAFMDYGFQLPQLESMLSQQQEQAFQNVAGMFGQLGGLT